MCVFIHTTSTGKRWKEPSTTKTNQTNNNVNDECYVFMSFGITDHSMLYKSHSHETKKISETPHDLTHSSAYSILQNTEDAEFADN